MSKVLYPGSFDPITKGHMNVIEQASDLFDEVVIAVLENKRKKSLFTIDERVEIIRHLYKNNDKIKVITASSASVDIAMLYECKAIVRGLRSISDYDYEVGLQQINKDISNNRVNTICLFADKEYQYISSSVVKEVLDLGKDISNYVDDFVCKKLILKKEGINNEE